MGDLTKNLSRHEFACKCNYPDCTRTPVDRDLAPALQGCVDHFAAIEADRLSPGWVGLWSKNPKFERVAITITSGYRCDKHNQDITDGKSSGIHTLGMAADFVMDYVYSDGSRKRVPAEEIADYLELQYSRRYGIGRYPRPDWKEGERDMPRTHFDTRCDGPARWSA